MLDMHLMGFFTEVLPKIGKWTPLGNDILALLSKITSTLLLYKLNFNEAPVRDYNVLQVTLRHGNDPTSFRR